MAGTEDQRAAANIYASLSSYVITASLGVIAAQAALATFVIDKREHLVWFYVWMISGIVASVVSIVLGGKGVAKIASGGFGGSWTLKPKEDFFNYQALFCLIGMGLLLVSLFGGTPKPENPEISRQIQRLNDSVQKLQGEVDGYRAQNAQLSEELKSSKCPQAGSRAAKAKKSR
jgi:hypothetical protein